METPFQKSLKKKIQNPIVKLWSELDFVQTGSGSKSRPEMASILDDDDDAYMISSNFSLVRYNNPIIIDKNEDLSKCPTPSGKPKGQKDTEEVKKTIYLFV